jgi:hypothetical protein
MPRLRLRQAASAAVSLPNTETMAFPMCVISLNAISCSEDTDRADSGHAGRAEARQVSRSAGIPLMRFVFDSTGSLNGWLSCPAGSTVIFIVFQRAVTARRPGRAKMPRCGSTDAHGRVCF